MDDTRNRMTPADALVIFGVTGDLAHKSNSNRSTRQLTAACPDCICSNAHC